jgi:hypothetical protein
VIGPPGYAPPLPLAYQLISGSPMIGAGLDLNAQFSINTGTQDYYGNANPRSGVNPIGAYGGPGRWRKSRSESRARKRPEVDGFRWLGVTSLQRNIELCAARRLRCPNPSRHPN